MVTVMDTLQPPFSTTRHPTHHHHHRRHHHHDLSMSREQQKQRAREAREFRVATEREPQPVMFGVVRRSPTVNNVERVLGDYETFRLGPNKMSLVGVDQQPPTPRPAPDPDPLLKPPPHPAATNPSSTSSSSSSRSQRPIPPPQSSPNTTPRPPKSQPSAIKPPHPLSTHAHTKNGEVKGNLKGGPGPGPGDGGGGRKSAAAKANLPPLKVEGAGGLDPKIQQIMSEMTLKDPVSAIVHTPRHDHHHHQQAFPFTSSSSSIASASARQPQRAGKTSEVTRSKQSQVADGGHINDELVLSEDSDEEQQGGGSVSGGVGQSMVSGPPFGTPSGPLQSSLGPASNTMMPLSPISSPKSSDESSTSEDSSDETEMSSNNSTDDEQVECSPKHQENKSDAWKLGNFITFRKTSSPMSTGAQGAGAPRTEDQPPLETKETLPPPARERTDRKVAKNPSASSSHHNGRSGQEARGWSKVEKTGLYDDSSDEGEQPHPRPTPRVSAEVRQTPKHGRDPASRTRPPKNKVPPSHSYLDSDSDSDVPGPRKVQPVAKGTAQEVDKSPKVSVPQATREPPKKFQRKRSETKKNSHLGAKSESGKTKREKRAKEFQSMETVYDSDSDASVDVVNPSPEKVPGRGGAQCTPSRTPKDIPKSVSSPMKAVVASPRASPKPSAAPSKVSAKRPGSSSNGGLSASLVSDSPASKSEDEDGSPGRSHTAPHKADVARNKGALVSRAFGTSAKKDRVGKDRDTAETKKKAKTEARKSSGGGGGSGGGVGSGSGGGGGGSGSGGGGNRRDRSDKSVRSRGASESSAAAAAAAVVSSPTNKACKSPLVSAEPKVPIPPLQFHDGVPKLTCTIPLSFIDKVPKPNVNGALSVNKSEVKEEEDRKLVLDYRTKEGKGKRKTCDPGSKATEDESKQKIISSIFGNVKRQDHESDDDKVKKEVKKEEEESEEERCGRSSSLRPTTTIKQEPGEVTPARQQVLASPRSPVSDTAISRQHRKKKQDRSPSTRDRKRPKKNSERHTQEQLSVPGSGNNSSLEGRGRRDGSLETEKWSRKRGHDRDSSLESTRSRANSECGENRNKKAKVCKGLGTPEAAASSPSSSRGASQRSAEDTHHAWTQDKEDPCQLKHLQRPQHSQQSSQYSHKGFNGVPDEAAVNHESEYNEDLDTTPAGARSIHQRLCGKDKIEESETTPSVDSNGYHSRPVSEHESRGSSSCYRSSGEPPKTAEPVVGPEAATLGGQMDTSCPLGAPMGQRPPGPSTTPNATGTLQSRPVGEQALLHGHYANPPERQYASYFERRIPEIDRDYNGYLNRAKELKHIADEETDRSMQAMKYLEAALYFILSGKAMESDHDTSASLTMYKDTLNFIKWVSSVFRRENQEGSINAKLAVISLRCQSLLSLKIYQMRRLEHKDNQRQLNKYFQNHSKAMSVETGGGTGQQWGGQRGGGSPSHPSQTPSPAGSVGSEGSQSSGYTTSTEGTRSKGGIVAPPVGHTPPHPQPPQGAHPSVPVVQVPLNIHTLIIKQNHLSSHLASAHDMWIEADEYVSKNNMQEFFIELDRQASPLTLHSSLPELVMYVQCGLHRIKA